MDLNKKCSCGEQLTTENTIDHGTTEDFGKRLKWFTCSKCKSTGVKEMKPAPAPLLVIVLQGLVDSEEQERNAHNANLLTALQSGEMSWDTVINKWESAGYHSLMPNHSSPKKSA